MFGLRGERLKQRVDAVLDVVQLSDRQRLVVECRYGLCGREATTLEQIASDLGLTRERVRQIQMEALTRLRKRIALDGLTPEALL